MKLREKTLLMISGIILAVILIFIFLSSSIFLKSYENLESNHLNETTDLLLKNVNNEMWNLNSIVLDWGVWDDTYRFVSGDRDFAPAYVETNLPNFTFINLHLNFIIMVNSSGAIQYGQGFDFEKMDFAPLRPDLLAEVADRESRFNSLTSQMDPHMPVTGFLDLPEGIVVITACPIVRSDYSGPPRGRIIMGRYLDRGEIGRIAKDTNLDISIVPLGKSPVSQGDRPVPTGGDDPPVLIRTPGDRVIGVNAVIRDIYGASSIVLAYHLPRDIVLQGRDTVLLFLSLQLAIIIIIGGLIFWQLDGQVLRRVININTDIATITRKKGPMGQITNEGNDEISQLVDALNLLFNQINTSQQAITESEKRFRQLAEDFPEMMIEADAQGTLTFVNRTACEITGYQASDFLQEGALFTIIDPEDRERAKQNFARLLTGESLKGNEYTIVKKNGTRSPVILYSAPFYQGETIAGVRIFAGDISQRKEAETILRNFNSELEQKVIERTAQISEMNQKLTGEIDTRLAAEQRLITTLNEKVVLLREVHHRVKNNLQVIASLLSIQADKTTDPAIRAPLIDSRNRVKSIALVHETLYRSKNFDRIEYGDYLRKMVEHLFNAYNVNPALVTYRIHTDHLYLNINNAVPCSLIINEMVTNSLKYAFPDGRKGEITIDFSNDEENYHLTCRDNGVGIPEQVSPGLNGSIGMMLIHGLTRQINGTLTLKRENGTTYTITFPCTRPAGENGEKSDTERNPGNPDTGPT